MQMIYLTHSWYESKLSYLIDIKLSFAKGGVNKEEIKKQYPECTTKSVLSKPLLRPGWSQVESSFTMQNVEYCSQKAES
jgi:hypothetical protein